MIVTNVSHLFQSSRIEGRQFSALSLPRAVSEHRIILKLFPLFRIRLSPGWDCQKPDQQSKQDEGSQKRKGSVQGMEMEVRIPREAMRQHETSYELALCGGNRWPVSLIVPLQGAGFQLFASCDTPLPCLKRLLY